MTEPLIIEGYASLFNVPDAAGDIIAPSAFAHNQANSTRLLYQHQVNEPLGIWLDMIEDDLGLYVYGKLEPEVTRAREIASLIKCGAIDGLSIGFKPVKSTQLAKGGRYIQAIDLWEISIVTFPVQQRARLKSFKPET